MSAEDEVKEEGVDQFEDTDQRVYQLDEQQWTGSSDTLISQMSPVPEDTSAITTVDPRKLSLTTNGDTTSVTPAGESMGGSPEYLTADNSISSSQLAFPGAQKILSIRTRQLQGQTPRYWSRGILLKIGGKPPKKDEHRNFISSIPPEHDVKHPSEPNSN